MSRMKRLPKTIKRGTTSLFVFGIALFPAISALNLFGGFHLTSSDSRNATVLPTFVHRPQDTAALRPFDEPIVTITFDDGWQSVYTQAAPLLQKYGIRSTQYLLSGTMNDPHYLSAAQAVALRDAGQEIGCHSVSHADLVTLNDTQLHAELAGCKEYYDRLFGMAGNSLPIENFASPYSSSNAHTIAAIKQLYKSHRDTSADITNGMVDVDVNSRDNFDQYNIISFAIRDDTTIEQIKTAVEYTIAHKAWLVLTYHQLEDNAAFGVSAQTLDEQFAYLSKQSVRIASIGDVINTLSSERREY
jgi:peptidoglycan/xylan/chitin deacetylase (PgdA/CDA1 family)